MRYLLIRKRPEGAKPVSDSSITPVSTTPISVAEVSHAAPAQKPLSHEKPSIVLEDIKKDYYVDKKPYPALKGISIAFPKCGFISILGPSGCGKTTLLNIIGGLDHYTSGDLLIEGKSTKDFVDAEWDAYRNEHVGFVFQSYNLIPHLNVLANVEISLMLNGLNKKTREARALKALDVVGLKDEAKKRPNQLSGGQQQRVALARAMVNNPTIILADEPTGALDSKTSVQVMDLLKDIAKDHLVIMVTHNRDLANAYSDRIIEMFDGIITKDSAPIAIPEGNSEGKDINKKTSMSFWTAFKSSLQSINTKKTRTVLTAVASSFGIIGVALVLAVANGFQLYVDNVEGSVASSVPITITPVDYSYLENDTSKQVEYPTDDNLVIYDTSTSSYISHTNKYNQEYFDYVNKTVELGYARSVMFNRQSLGFNLLTQDGDQLNDDGTKKTRTIDQYANASMSASVVSSVTSLPTTIFHELYGEEKGISTMYDCIYGNYPQNPDELVLIVDRYNRVDFTTLQNLGVIGTDKKMGTIDSKTVSFDKLIYSGTGDSEYKTYNAYLNSDYFDMYDTSGNAVPMTTTSVPTWNITKFDTTANKFVGEESTKDIHSYDVQRSIDKIYNNTTGRYHPISLKIVGVLRPSKNSYINLMPSSIGYLSGLKDQIAADVAVGGKGENLGKIASDNFYIRRKLPTDGASVIDGLETLNSSVKNAFAALGNGSVSSISESSVNDVLSNIYTYRWYYRYEGADQPGTISASSNLYWFLRFNRSVGGDFREASITDIPAIPTSTYSKDDETWNKFMAYWIEKLQDPKFYNNTIDADNKWGAMDFLAYYNSYALVSSILIFPSSLTKKDALHSYLDAYNVGKADTDKILYSDIMKTFTESLGVLIQVISIVLIVFASISLVVSSVMTGIITYVSVIERTKEIGILRACGARKKDVARLFEAECVTIGLGAGGIGVLFTYLACFPINQILDHQFPGNNLSSIAFLNPWHALILLGLAVVLALVSGAIPAFMASKKDPVVALRTE
jgi:putative ABC transport system permease protein